MLGAGPVPFVSGGLFTLGSGLGRGAHKVFSDGIFKLSNILLLLISLGRQFHFSLTRTLKKLRRISSLALYIQRVGGPSRDRAAAGGSRVFGEPCHWIHIIDSRH